MSDQGDDRNMSDVVFITCVRNFEMYARCVQDNRFARGDKILLDNTVENLPIPLRYNQFLESFDYRRNAWFVFCHEDFELKEDINKLLCNLSQQNLYGPIGSKRIGLFGVGRQVICGSLVPCGEEGEVRAIGQKVPLGAQVDTFDCCCLIVHSSLVERHHLRFDEELEWDMYVEDFCANAMTCARVRSLIVPIECQHHGRCGEKEIERLKQHLPHLDSKYPNRCFSGIFTYFGRRPILMRIESWLLKFLAFRR